MEMNKYILVSCLLIGILIAFSNVVAHDHNITESFDKPSLKTAAAFDKMMQVITHKRCVNCHPSGDTPRQGEDSHLHYFGVQRGVDGQGLAGYTCATCHHEENNLYAGVPGAPHWGLAPASMAWEDKSKVEIATQMMDPARNGGKNAQEILKHLTEDELVLWAWEPGVDDEGVPRETPPLSKKEWITTVEAWINNGAIIPAE